MNGLKILQEWSFFPSIAYTTCGQAMQAGMVSDSLELICMLHNKPDLYTRR